MVFSATLTKDELRDFFAVYWKDRGFVLVDYTVDEHNVNFQLSRNEFTVVSEKLSGPGKKRGRPAKQTFEDVPPSIAPSTIPPTPESVPSWEPGKIMCDTK